MKTTSGRKPHGNSRLAKIAEAALRPVPKPKSKGGAPKGNKNALRHGRHTAELRARRARLADLRRSARAVIAQVEAWVDERRRLLAAAEAAAALLPGAPPEEDAQAKVTRAPLPQFIHDVTE